MTLCLIVVVPVWNYTDCSTHVKGRNRQNPPKVSNSKMDTNTKYSLVFLFSFLSFSFIFFPFLFFSFLFFSYWHTQINAYMFHVYEPSSSAPSSDMGDAGKGKNKCRNCNASFFWYLALKKKRLEQYGVGVEVWNPGKHTHFPLFPPFKGPGARHLIHQISKKRDFFWWKKKEKGAWCDLGSDEGKHPSTDVLHCP